MYIHIVKRYLILANNGIVEKYDCPMDPEHGSLQPNIDLNDKVFIYCLYCSYKRYLGIETLKDMELQVIDHTLQSDLRHFVGLE